MHGVDSTFISYLVVSYYNHSRMLGYHTLLLGTIAFGKQKYRFCFVDFA